MQCFNKQVVARQITQNICRKGKKVFRVLLVYPSNPDLPRHFFKMMGRNPHVGLLSIGGVLQRHGVECRYLDAFNRRYSISQTVEMILQYNFEMVAITSNTSNFFSAVQIARAVRERSKAKIVIGGQHASNMSGQVISNGAFDYIIRGEGEYPLLQLVKALQGDYEIQDIKGLVYKKGDGSISSSPPDLIKDLGSLPVRAWNLLDLSEYCPSAGSCRRGPAISTMMQRGCIKRCIFCSVNSIFKHRTRQHSLSFLEYELDYFKNRGLKDIQFWDSTFSYDREWAISAAYMLKKYGFLWNCIDRLDNVDEELLEIFADCGCYAIGYGVEAGTQKSLDLMKKDQAISDVRRTVALTKKAGIMVRAFFTLGFPWETREDIDATVSFAHELKPEIAAFSIVNAYPGAPLFADFSNRFQDIEKCRGVHNLSGQNCVNEKLSQIELQRIRDNAQLRYYLSFTYLLTIVRQIRDFSYFKHLIKSFIEIFILR